MQARILVPGIMYRKQLVICQKYLSNACRSRKKRDWAGGMAASIVTETVSIAMLA
jgi:hypothetical protein